MWWILYILCCPGAKDSAQKACAPEHYISLLGHRGFFICHKICIYTILRSCRVSLHYLLLIWLSSPSPATSTVRSPVASLTYKMLHIPLPSFWHGIKAFTMFPYLSTYYLQNFLPGPCSLGFLYGFNILNHSSVCKKLAKTSGVSNSLAL